MPSPLAVDLFCGRGGWTIGLQAAGWRVIGFDIERHLTYPGQLVLQDVALIDGRAFRGRVSLIVASPPCQAYSYRAMPWKRAKALPPPDNSLFEHCFRIAREAECSIVVENVRGAQPWVGKAGGKYGSFYLWGDVPPLLPPVRRCFKTVGHVNRRDDHGHTRHFTNQRKSDAVKNGGDWFSSGPNCSEQRRHSSGSLSRKEASARIAMIPFDLARWIGECFYSQTEAAHAR